MADNDKTIVLKLGGSLIYPNGGLDIDYIKKFYDFIRQEVTEKNRRFFILIGGGTLSRHYRDAGAEITGHELKKDDLDWLGIHATRLNAHLFRTIFREMAHPTIINDYEFIQKPEKPIVIAAGWKPGWSTDYDAVILAQDYNIKKIVKMSNATHVFDKDPNKFRDAKPFEKISWKDYKAMVGDEWVPGNHAPFDPIAAKIASDLDIDVVYLNGKDLSNVEKAMDEENFVGTTIGK
ncbi:MAG: UMP kinase [Patescibacteria group bacterium]|nr:UMP kinase [Patescibacteria group bacterium]